ncbi:MAG: nucleotidyltransferase domain-containing protein [Sulfolobales archaeon]
MSKVAPAREFREVIYGRERFELLRRFREKAIDILLHLERYGLKGYVHGSVARGDVSRDSDIDIVVLEVVNPVIISVALEGLGGYSHAEIIMATPIHTPKIYFYLDPQESIVVSAPLGRLSLVESEFYRFGGVIDLVGLLESKRVVGVDKRLMLIIPTEKGHIERSVIGYESETARILNISIETVLDRVKALTRRDEHGRTGVFIKRRISYNESIEETIDSLCREESAFRRKTTQYGICR